MNDLLSTKKKMNIGNVVRAAVLVGIGFIGGYLIPGHSTSYYVPNYKAMTVGQVLAMEQKEYDSMTPAQKDAVRDKYVQKLDGNLLKRIGGFFETMYDAAKGVAHKDNYIAEPAKAAPVKK